MKPVLVIPGTAYVVCFETQPENSGMRSHFIGECGWTEEQFAEVEDFPWFQVTVSLWRDGQLLEEGFLGACCYETEDSFWTTHAGDYFSDMVCELAKSTGDAATIAWANRWRQDLRNPSPTLKETQA